MIKKTLPLIVVMLFVLTSCTKNNPEAVTVRFYDALQRSAFSEALTYTNVPAENVEQTAIIVEKMGMHIQDYEVVSVEKEEGDTTASVVVHNRVTFDGVADTVEASPEIRCAKIDGQWKVVFFM